MPSPIQLIRPGALLGLDPGTLPQGTIQSWLQGEVGMGASRSRDGTPADDAELVHRFQARQGREQAFLDLFERHGPVTYCFLRRRVGDPEIAAELNQELFLNVLQGLDRFRAESSFRTWLFRLAQNQLANLRRRWRTRIDERLQAVPDELAREVLVAGDERPDAAAERGERDDLLGRCLAVLTEVERGVIIGQYYEGVTLEELTRRFGLTNPSGARASLIAAQRKLRRCLREAGIGPEAIDTATEGMTSRRQRSGR